MRIDPIEPEPDPFEHLTPLQNKSRKAAIVVSFIGVFVWVIKILFL
ncbi:hypothetical protein [Mucilaginibacter flavus]|nr:hypothetical protein [Mucilaginibacter flavus]MDN3579767.1 hypothetical protein [Mucilaginibacter flavus]